MTMPIMPGANQVNLAVFIGTKMRGIPAIAVVGLCLVPVAIILTLASYFTSRRCRR